MKRILKTDQLKRAEFVTDDRLCLPFLSLGLKPSLVVVPFQPQNIEPAHYWGVPKDPNAAFFAAFPGLLHHLVHFTSKTCGTGTDDQSIFILIYCRHAASSIHSMQLPFIHFLRILVRLKGTVDSSEHPEQRMKENLFFGQGKAHSK